MNNRPTAISSPSVRQVLNSQYILWRIRKIADNQIATQTVFSKHPFQFTVRLPGSTCCNQFINKVVTMQNGLFVLFVIDYLTVCVCFYYSVVQQSYNKTILILQNASRLSAGAQLIFPPLTSTKQKRSAAGRRMLIYTMFSIQHNTCQLMSAVMPTVMSEK